MAASPQESVWSRIHQQYVKGRVLWGKYNMTQAVIALSRALICSYFFNQAYTGLSIWYYYKQPFPWLHIWLLPCSILVTFKQRINIFASILAVIALYDVLLIFGSQLTVWYQHGYLYINELMVKKMSLLGSIGLILAFEWQNDSGRKPSAVAGLLITQAEKAMSDQKSLVMLIGRLLMSTLFLYVGYTEVKRQWESVYTDSAGHVHHRRAAGDGHDNMWSKLTEFTLSIPFIVGFKSNLTARLLALVLILEAMVSWLWFLSPLNIGYKIHAREHFTVNVGVAGALMLFAHIGAGKYTVDNYLKKTE